MEHTIATDPKEIRYIKKDAGKLSERKCAFTYAEFFRLRKI